MTIEFDLMNTREHDEWSERRPARPIEHKKQRLRIFASHFPPEGRVFDCSIFRVDQRGSLILQNRGSLVCAFGPNQWQSFENVPIDDEPADTA